MDLEKIEKLKSEFPKYKQEDKENEFYLKMSILYAIRDNTLDKLKSTLVAKEVAKEYTLDEQIEILLNGDVTALTGLRLCRQQITVEVNALIQSMTAELEEQI